ncbi:MAG: PAS domain S-box protein [Richelia sp. SM2_1_7]|nr:PAS domain S-box protein [Richelia sp. SM2_1_7]
MQLQDALKTGTKLEIELNVFFPKHDQSRRINLLAQPIFTDGFTHKVVGILQDLSTITGRTEELHLLQFGINHAFSMIYWVMEDASFKYVNPTMCQKLGYSQAELLQLNLTDIEPDLTYEKWQQQWQLLKQQKNLGIRTQPPY